jgi:hypothetical protein
MLPNFIIIGAQRGGTTSLYHYITKHPKIIPALQKEIHFFDINYKKGVSWYQSQFRQNFSFRLIFKKKKIKEHITGEASPYYIYHPHVPKRISKIIPDVKLLALLRNPIERAFSHYHHERSMGVEKMSFEDAIKEEPKRLKGELEKMLSDENYYSFNHQNFSYLDRGIYIDQLVRWEKFFPKKQILILSSEEFYSDPDKICKDVFDFLGLPVINIKNKKTFNKGKYQIMNDKTRLDLVEYFKPHNEKLFNFLKRDFGWK